MRSRTTLMLSIAVGILFGFIVAPSIGQSGELLVQTDAHEELAAAGNDLYVLITVVVTKKGKPERDLEDDNFTLWTIPGSFNGLSPLITLVDELEGGVYQLVVEPDDIWAAGEYHYVVQVKRGGKRGRGLGVVVIPEASSSPSP